VLDENLSDDLCTIKLVEQPDRARSSVPARARVLQFFLRQLIEEEPMWNKDEVRGKVDQVKGRIKEAAGDLKNDERLRNEGKADRAAGSVKETFGKGRRKVGEAIKDLGNEIKK